MELSSSTDLKDQRRTVVPSRPKDHQKGSTIPPRQHTSNQARRFSKTESNTSLPHSGPHYSSCRLPQHPPPRQPFSLAGGRIPPNHGGSYVDPNYHEYNPKCQKEQSIPLWGLAKPLPRVVRQGMRRRRSVEHETTEDTGAEINEPGSSEAIPQLGMINDQRNEVGKQPVGSQERNTKTRQRGYGHQDNCRTTTGDTVPRAGLQKSIVDPYSSPMHERSDPMDEWGGQTVSGRTDALDDRLGEIGDTSMNQLPSVEEIPSEPISNTTTSFECHTAISNSDDIDLEAGAKLDEWPVQDGEEGQYLEEERDMHNSWANFRAKFREPLAECLATMIAVLLGLCTNLAVQTSKDTSGSYQSMNWAWGLGVTIGIYIAGGISGAHLNPAISLMLCLYRGFPFRKALVYISAQVLGAFLAGMIAYGVYKDAISAFDALGGSMGSDGGSTQAVGLSTGGTGISFFSQPASFVGAGSGFANEFVATAILACAILALGDDSNAPPGAGMHALIVGLLVTVLSMAFGYNTGACLNPARDFGPRLAAAVVGYGGEVFTVSNAWWIYGAWGATISGGLVGGLFYDAAIFVGGESPVNYPRGKRKLVKRKAKDGAKRSWWDVKRMTR